MAKSKEPKLFAYETFMEQARKEGRVRNETLSMKVLKPDLSLQARVNHIDKDHVRALHEILKNGQPLAPIIVFEVATGEFKIADGFHRHEVYKREGSLGIPCTIIKGTLQEAIEYAASCNQKLSLARTREDTKKAAFMLFDSGWLGRSDNSTSKQIGVSPATIAKYKIEYCDVRDVAIPDLIVDDSGKERRRRSGNSAIVMSHIRKPDSSGANRNYYQTRVGRKVILLGKDKRKAEEKFAEIVEARSDKFSAFVDIKAFTRKMNGLGIGLMQVQADDDNVLKFVSGRRTDSCSVTILESWEASSILAAFSRAAFIAEHFKLPRKIVVVREESDSFQGLVAIAVRLGIEFMTVDQFVDTMKKSV